MDTPNDDYDNPWKIALERYFREFLAIFCPWLEEAIDWSVEPTFHDQELRQPTRDARNGLRRLDKLAKVRLLDGGELYIHIEVQLSRVAGFARRMFTCFSRLFDRYDCQIASIAVLADRSRRWRPSRFDCKGLGIRLAFAFTPVKLLDFCPPPHGCEGNFFALVTEGHFATLRTRHDPETRLASKLKLVEFIYGLAWPERRVRDFHDVIDWMMYLPAPQQETFKVALAKIEGRFKMPYVNSMIRDAISEGKALGFAQGREEGREQGREEGKRKLFAEMLEQRFGRLTAKDVARVDSSTPDEFSRWVAKAFEAKTLAEVLGE